MGDPVAEQLVEQGLERYGRGDLDGALMAWENALQIDPEDERAASYVDYVRAHYDLLSGRGGAAAAELAVPFGLTTLDDDAGYEIELSTSEMQRARVERFIDQVDDGWFIDEAAALPEVAPLPPPMGRQVPMSLDLDALDLGPPMQGGAEGSDAERTLELEAEEPGSGSLSIGSGAFALDPGFDDAGLGAAGATAADGGRAGSFGDDDQTHDFYGKRLGGGRDHGLQEATSDFDFGGGEATAELESRKLGFVRVTGQMGTGVGTEPGMGAGPMSPRASHDDPSGDAPLPGSAWAGADSQTAEVVVRFRRDDDAAPATARTPTPRAIASPASTPVTSSSAESNPRATLPRGIPATTPLPTLPTRALPATTPIPTQQPMTAPGRGRPNTSPAITNAADSRPTLDLYPAVPASGLDLDALDLAPPIAPSARVPAPREARPPSAGGLGDEELTTERARWGADLAGVAPGGPARTPSAAPTRGTPIAPFDDGLDLDEPAASTTSPLVIVEDPVLADASSFTASARAPTRDLAREFDRDVATAQRKKMAAALRPPPSADVVPAEGVAAELLAELDRDVPAGEAKDDRVRRRVTALLDRAAAADREGRHTVAVTAVDLALSEEPDSAIAQKLVHRSRDPILAIYQHFVGNLEARPALAIPMHELAHERLDSRAAFLLSRVDGSLTFDEILDVSGMPRLEAFRHLARLLLRHILEVR